MIEMTFPDYIENPMGKKNAVFSQRNVYRNLYTDKFDKLFLRVAGKIWYKLYIDKQHDRYYIHIKIPSESIKDLFYDAVVEFYTDDAAIRSSNNLSGYYVKFFTNDAAFMYTYAYVFYKEGLIIDDLKNRCSKRAIKNSPDIKNYYQTPGYSKILYFAFLFMKLKNLFSKSLFLSYAEKYSSSKLKTAVASMDTKQAEYYDAKSDTSRSLKEETKKRTKKQEEKDLQKYASVNVGVTKRTKNVTKTKTAKKTGYTKTAKYSKKIK